jgi:hypothetical protein
MDSLTPGFAFNFVVVTRTCKGFLPVPDDTEDE